MFGRCWAVLCFNNVGSLEVLDTPRLVVLILVLYHLDILPYLFSTIGRVCIKGFMRVFHVLSDKPLIGIEFSTCKHTICFIEDVHI